MKHEAPFFSNLVETGILESWSNGVLHLKPNLQILQYSRIPTVLTHES